MNMRRLMLTATALIIAGAAIGTASVATKAHAAGATAPISAGGTACAGEWTRAVASINDPAHQNTMVIRSAANLQDAVRRAHVCRSDVGNVSYFEEGARLACAPYIACSAL
jgi:hypothetical protein